MIGHKLKVVKRKLPRYLIRNSLQDVIFHWIGNKVVIICAAFRKKKDLFLRANLRNFSRKYFFHAEKLHYFLSFRTVKDIFLTPNLFDPPVIDNNNLVPGFLS
jgi:hypothetical protein